MSVVEIASVPPEPNEVEIRERTQALLTSSKWARASDLTCSGLIKRLDMMRDAGLPPMKVIAAEEIEFFASKNGRMPRSTDLDVILEDAHEVVQKHGETAMGLSNAVFVFLSHQQARNDDGGPLNDMAGASVAFAKNLEREWYINRTEDQCAYGCCGRASNATAYCFFLILKCGWIFCRLPYQQRC